MITRDSEQKATKVTKKTVRVAYVQALSGAATGRVSIGATYFVAPSERAYSGGGD